MVTSARLGVRADPHGAYGQRRRRLHDRAHEADLIVELPALRRGQLTQRFDGVVGGVWHQRRSGRKLAITVEPLCELTAPHRRQLDDEVGLVGAVMEATATLTVGTVRVGPHA